MDKLGLVFAFVVAIGAIIYCYKPLTFWVRDAYKAPNAEMPKWLSFFFDRELYRQHLQSNKEIDEQFSEKDIRRRTR